MLKMKEIAVYEYEKKIVIIRMSWLVAFNEIYLKENVLAKC